MAEVNSALIGYAVLRANYDAQAPTYIDNFGGFVLAAIANLDTKYPARDRIARYIEDAFGLRIPDLVVGRMLKRLRGKKLVELIAGDAHVLTQAGIEVAPSVTEQASKFGRQQAELTVHFEEFVRSTLPEHADILDGSASDALAGYFDRHAVPILNQSLRGRSSSGSDYSAGYDYLISRYVAHLAATDQVRFGYVEDASKGAVLASVLTLDTLGFSQSLNKMSIFLDTPLILNLLGLHGDVPQLATAQLVELGSSQGARMCAFEHSLKEIEGLLDGVESSLRRAKSNSTNAVFLHLVETGATASDVAVIQRSLQRDLLALGVRIVEKPDTYRQYGLDENALETQLQEKIGYRESSSRQYDVDSLSAVHRLRRGATTRHFEECGAVLVTANTGVVRAANTFASERHPFPLAITGEAIAGLLWVRAPATAESASRSQLIATAYAGMQPSGNLWSRYLAEIDALEKRNEITSEDAIVLRATSTGREAFMEETLGDLTEVTGDSPFAVLERIRDHHQAPLNVELAAKDKELAEEKRERKRLNKIEGALSSAEKALEALREEKANADKVRRARASTEAKRWVRIPLVVLLLLVAAAAVLNVFGVIVPTWQFAPIGFALVAGGTVLSLLPAFLPGSLIDWLRPLERRIERSRYRTLCALAGASAVEEGKIRATR